MTILSSFINLLHLYISYHSNLDYSWKNTILSLVMQLLTTEQNINKNATNHMQPLISPTQLKDDSKYTCQLYSSKEEYYRCFRDGQTGPRTTRPGCINPRAEDDVGLGNMFSAGVCLDIQVRWIWCLVFIMATPEALVLVRSLWNIAFKKRRFPSWDALFVVSPAPNNHVSFFEFA